MKDLSSGSGHGHRQKAVMLFPILLWWVEPSWQVSPHPDILTYPVVMGERIRRAQVRKTFLKVFEFYIITRLVSV